MEEYASSVDIFKDQQELDDRIQLESFILQASVNATLIIITLLIFCILRSKYPNIYESKRTSCKSK